MIRYIFLLASAIVVTALIILVFSLPTEKSALPEQSQLETAKLIAFDGADIDNIVLGRFDTSAPNKLATIDNFMWRLSDDGVANGKSKANIEVVSKEGSDNGVLKVSAMVNAGFPYPWAGAAVCDFTMPVEGVDASGYSKVVFDVKGNPGTYRVLTFDAIAVGIPPSQNFTVSNQWTTVSLSLSEFAGLNTKLLSGFAFVAGPAIGDFEFYLDNIRIE